MRNLLTATILAAGIAQAAGNPVLVKVTAQHGAVQAIGSGVCLDTPCLHVLTNYHVAAFLGDTLQVEGVTVGNAQLYTGPDDSGAQEMTVALGVYKYNPAKDLALLTLSTPLPSRFIGAQFASYDARIGQVVVRQARFGSEYDVVAGKVVADSVMHTSSAGVLTALPRHFLLDCPSRAGNSGGIVTDDQGKVLGLVIMRSTDGLGQAGTIAISSALVSDFLHTANEPLWNALFPAPAVMVTRQESLPTGLGTIAPPVSAPSEAVGALRVKAHENALAMQNVVAIESIDTWGRNEPKRSSLYQIAMYSEGQKYQKLTANGAPAKQTATSAIAWPRMTGVVPGEQWSIVSLLMDDASIVYEGTAAYQGKAVNVFRYVSSATGCGSRRLGQIVFAHCAGVVIADGEMNTVLLTQQMDLAQGEASVIRWSERFELVRVAGRAVLLPTELNMSGDFRTGKTYFASAQWRGYHAFAAETAIRFDDSVE